MFLACVTCHREESVCFSGEVRGLVWTVCAVVSLSAWMYLIMLPKAPQGWSREHGHRLPTPPPCPQLASGTQLPHLTFSIWPLSRGEIARVSKRGCHTSWILLSFNLHSPLFTLVMHMDQEWRYCSIKRISEVAPEVLQLFLCRAEVLMYHGYGYWVHRVCVMLWHPHIAGGKQALSQQQELAFTFKK